MKVIVNGDNFLYVDKNLVKLVMCGRETNKSLSTYLQNLKVSEEADDKTLLKNIVSSRTLQNFYMTYNHIPEKDTKIFKHGHKINFIGTNSLFKAPSKPENKTLDFIQVLEFDRINSMCSALGSESEKTAIDNYKSMTGDSPSYIVTFCSFCQTVNDFKNREDGKVSSLINEEIITI